MATKIDWDRVQCQSRLGKERYMGFAVKARTARLPGRTCVCRAMLVGVVTKRRLRPCNYFRADEGKTEGTYGDRCACARRSPTRKLFGPVSVYAEASWLVVEHRNHLTTTQQSADDQNITKQFATTPLC
jgi:hypothetical protein